MKKTITTARRIRLVFAAIAALAVIQAAPALADGPLLPGKLPDVSVRENAGSLNYGVHVPCHVPAPHDDGEWRYWEVCQYTLTISSGTAKMATPDQGGDAYSFQMPTQLSGQVRTKQRYDYRAGEDVTLPFRIVNDRRHESDEALFADLRVTGMACHVWMGNGGRYPACNTKTGLNERYQGMITILDDDPAFDPSSSYVERPSYRLSP